MGEVQVSSFHPEKKACGKQSPACKVINLYETAHKAKKKLALMTGSEKLLPGSGGLKYRLRVSKRRRTVGLKITDAGELVVYAPRGLSQKAIHGVIEKNMAWIARKQAEWREAWARLKPDKVYHQGKALHLRMVPPGVADVRLGEGALLVPAGMAPEGLWSLLLAWYRREAESLLAQRVQHFAPQLGLATPPLELRDWRRRWGECHPKGRLRFNWRLVLLPPEIMDYVVVHELAHLLVPGHPPRFWQEVEKFLPDFAARRRWLQRFGAPFLRWRPDLD